MLNKKIVFDLDGTLIDTASIVVKLLNELRQQRGMPPKDRREFNKLLSLGGHDLIAFALNLTSQNDKAKIKKSLKLFRSNYAQITTDKKLVYRNVIKTLDALSELDFHMGVCTNKPRHLALKALDDTNLSKYFKTLLCSDDLNTSKPDPKLIEELSRRFNANYEDIILIGDSILDYQLAQNAGIDFIFFTDGYNNNEAILKVQPKFSDYKELIPLLLKQNS